MYVASPKYFIEKLFSNDSLVSCNIWTSFPISNMSSTYKIRKFTLFPLNLTTSSRLENVHVIMITLDEAKRFDYLIKANIPTPRCLLQPINGFLKFAYLVSISRIDKTLGLYHIHVLG